MQIKGRHVKYPAMSMKVMDYILLGWHTGSPVSRQLCYIKCREWGRKGDAFYEQYINYNKKNSGQQLCHKLSRLLARMDFSSRKETVSQKIPDNWEEQSREFSKQTIEYFHKNKVEVICCADKTFIKYLLAKENLLVSTGTRRVGTGIESADERKGITLM